MKRIDPPKPPKEPTPHVWRTSPTSLLAHLVRQDEANSKTPVFARCGMSVGIPHHPKDLEYLWKCRKCDERLANHPTVKVVDEDD